MKISILPPKKSSHVSPKKWPSLGKALQQTLGSNYGFSLLVLIALISGIIHDYYTVQTQKAELAERLPALKTHIDHQENTLSTYFAKTNQTIALQSTALAPQATGLLIWNIEQALGMISISNLPPISKEQYYFLWMESDEGIILLEKFQPTSRGDWFHSMKSSFKGKLLGKIFLSLESSSHASRPEGPIYLETKDKAMGFGVLGYDDEHQLPA